MSFHIARSNKTEKFSRDMEIESRWNYEYFIILHPRSGESTEGVGRRWNGSCSMNLYWDDTTHWSNVSHESEDKKQNQIGSMNVEHKNFHSFFIEIRLNKMRGKKWWRLQQRNKKFEISTESESRLWAFDGIKDRKAPSSISSLRKNLFHYLIIFTSSSSFFYVPKLDGETVV